MLLHMPTQIGTMKPLGSLNFQQQSPIPVSTPLINKLNSFPNEIQSFPMKEPIYNSPGNMQSLPDNKVKFQALDSSPILIQTRKHESLILSASIYNPEDLIVVGPPNRSSYVNNTAQTMSVINSIPKMANVPVFVYLKDPNTGNIVRYLAQDERDLRYYDTDPDYGISQEWLLNNRQGDNYDRVPEWTQTVEIDDRERNNEQGYTTLNRGRIWYGIPRPQILPPSASYQEYERLMEYAQMQMEDGQD